MALIYFLFRIVTTLERIGGKGDSYLAKIRLGVRAIEKETSHLGPEVTRLNEGLGRLAGQLCDGGREPLFCRSSAVAREGGLPMNPLVSFIWLFTLLGTIFAVLPNLVSWLIRALAAARHIEQYTEEILAAGMGIADNTSNVTALKETLAVAPQLVSGAESLESHVAALEAALTPGSERGQ